MDMSWGGGMSGVEWGYIQRGLCPGVGIPWDLGFLPRVRTTSGSHQNMYDWQAGGMHPTTGMLSCLKSI